MNTPFRNTPARPWPAVEISLHFWGAWLRIANPERKLFFEDIPSPTRDEILIQLDDMAEEFDIPHE